MKFGIVDEYKAPNKINELFEKDVQKQRFYKEAKREEHKNYDPKIANQRTLKFVETYVSECRKAIEVPVPHFAQLVGNKLFLTQDNISDGQAAALADLLYKAGDQKVLVMRNETEVQNERLIQTLVIDDCKLSDSNFAKILDAIKNQQTLRSLCYQSCPFGAKSMKSLNELFMSQNQTTYLIDISFSNLPVKTHMIRRIMSSV